MNSIDLNCDMGEMPEAIADGTQESLMPFLTSVNIACGGHAGDENTMRITIEQALRRNLAVGAHPGYPDRANFGRLALDLPTDVIAQSVFEQVSTLAKIAAKCGARISHVKAHGALYNQAARDSPIAEAVANGVGRWRSDVVLVGLAGSPALDVFRRAGFAVNNFLFYGTAGFAFGQLRAETVGFATESHSNVGWTAGVGAEAGFGANWSAKVEYLFVDLSGSTFALTGTNNGLTSNLFRMGVNYHF